MSVSMSDHDRDCPCFEDRFGKCNCKAQLIADFVTEIAQLRAALGESVAREAACLEKIAKDRCFSAQMGLMRSVSEFNPNPAAAELLRDRKIANAARECEAMKQGSSDRWLKEKNLWIIVRDSISRTEQEQNDDR